MSKNVLKPAVITNANSDMQQITH